MKQLSIAILLLLPGGVPAWAQTDVYVTNLPDVQRVEGQVSIREPAPHTRMVRLPERVVAPVDRSDANSLVAGGLVDATGFRNAVLSVAGYVQGRLGTAGKIGAVLVADEEPILQAFNEAGLIQLGLDASAAVVRTDSYFAGSEPVQLAFPRYQVYYYNTTDRAVSVRLYAYLSN